MVIVSINVLKVRNLFIFFLNYTLSILSKKYFILTPFDNNNWKLIIKEVHQIIWITLVFVILNVLDVYIHLQKIELCVKDVFHRIHMLIIDPRSVWQVSFVITIKLPVISNKDVMMRIVVVDLSITLKDNVEVIVLQGIILFINWMYFFYFICWKNILWW